MANLFCSVGAMKAGTTWLHRQLVTHPDIFFTPEKEIHYLADPTGKLGAMKLSNRIQRFRQVVANLNELGINSRVRRNLNWYVNKYLSDSVDKSWYISLFDQKKEEKYVADFSNLYCLMDTNGWRNAHLCAKQIKVLYTMRSPIERLWSHVKFHHHLDPNFNYIEVSVNDWKRMTNIEGVAPYAEYGTAIRKLRSSIGESNLLFQFFEDVRSNEIDALRKIEYFLGVSNYNYDKEKVGRVVNPSTSVPIPRNFYRFAIRHHERQIHEVEKLGFKVPASWRNPFYE